MITITALSQYLLKDLYEYHGFDFLQKNEPDCFDSAFADHRTGSVERIVRRGSSQRVGRLLNQGATPTLFRATLQHDAPGVDPVASAFGILRRGLTDPVDVCCNAVERRLTAPLGDSYPWAHEASPSIAASRSLVRSVPKKFRDEITANAEEHAYQKFLRINSRCAEWRLTTQFRWEEELVGLLKRELDDFFHPGGEPLIPSETAIFDRGRCGPGASLGANGVDFYTKLFSSKLTATSLDVYYQYAAWCAADPKWRDAEFLRLTSFGLPNITCESQVTFVAKNRDTLRSICTEPNLNMFVQLGIGGILEDRLSSLFGIGLSTQPERNAELARLGSIAGAISTIDLESASDSLSLGMLEEVLPQWVFDTLCTYRCPMTKVRGERVLLHMISTMGNGFTFPLQTIVFACCVRAVARLYSARLGRADTVLTTWGVYGDDIACPTFMVGTLCHLLGLLGFQVNGEKSFTDKCGIFRESCGHDFYMGHDIRGVYLKSLRSPQSRILAINLLNEWSARWEIPLIRTIGYLRDSVKVLAIPPWGAPDTGIRVPLEAILTGYTSVRRGERKKNKGFFLFSLYKADIPALRVLDDVIAIPRNLNRVPRRMYNPHGLLIAAIGGYLRDGKVPLALKQGENPNYRTILGETPFWGPSGEQVRSQGLGFWERWITAVLVNLGYKDPEA